MWATLELILDTEDFRDVTGFKYPGLVGTKQVNVALGIGSIANDIRSSVFTASYLQLAKRHFDLGKYNKQD